MPQTHIIVIEGNIGSGKTYLLEKLKKQYGGKHIVYQDFDEINALIGSGPDYIKMTRDMRLAETNQEIHALIDTAIARNKKLIIISGVTVWDEYDFFAKERFESYDLTKLWYDVDPLECLIRNLYRYQEPSESDKQAVKQYLQNNRKTPLKALDFRQINVINKEGLLLVSNIMNGLICNSGLEVTTDLDTFMMSSGLRGGITKAQTIIEDYHYLPCSEEKITRCIGEIVNNKPLIGFFSQQVNNTRLLAKSHFNDHLESIKQKAEALSLNFPDAAKEAMQIYEKLTEYKKQFTNGTLSPQQFIMACKESINPENTQDLSKHRGILGDIQKIILMLIKAVKSTATFTINTNSMNKIKDIKKSLDSIDEDTIDEDTSASSTPT